MTRYYVIHSRKKKYHMVDAYSLEDVNAYAKMEWGKSATVTDSFAAIRGLKNSGLAELPAGFGSNR